MTNSILENDNLKIEINSHGAELQSLFDKQRRLEYLWQADEKYWPRHAPILFPIVGKLVNNELIYQDKSYPMSQHGFARDRNFTLVKHNESEVQFQFKSDSESLKQFPFEFELLVTYVLQANKLITSFSVNNPNSHTLPISIGAHPAFNWPLDPNIPKSEHYIKFEHDETAPVRQLRQGLLMEQSIENPIDKDQLKITESLFENDALIFDELNSQSIRYCAGDKMALELSFKEFPYLGIWKKPGANFVCLEPWCGIASPENYKGSFMEKPGIILVPRNEQIIKTFEISIN